MSHHTEPTFFELRHKKIRITYASERIELSYYDPVYRQYQQHFQARDIRLEQGAPGLLVSIYLLKEIDQGYLSLTLLLPSIEMAGAVMVEFETIALLTTHLYGQQAISRGARERYRVLSLKGKASFLTAPDLGDKK